MGKDFERTDLRVAKRKIDAGSGFVVGHHSYGRVDRMSDEELVVVASSVGELVRQANELLDAIGVETFSRLCGQSEQENV